MTYIVLRTFEEAVAHVVKLEYERQVCLPWRALRHYLFEDWK